MPCQVHSLSDLGGWQLHEAHPAGDQPLCKAGALRGGSLNVMGARWHKHVVWQKAHKSLSGSSGASHPGAVITKCHQSQHMRIAGACHSCTLGASMMLHTWRHGHTLDLDPLV